MPDHHQSAHDIASGHRTPAAEDNTPEALQATQRAKAAYQRGDWMDTERLCRSILQEQPAHFDALNLLGIVAAQTQRPLEAVELLSRAVAANPNHAMVHSNLGNVLHDLGRHEEALESCNRALQIQPDYMDALYNRGAVLKDLNRHTEALECYDRALNIQPHNAEGLTNRGSVLRNLGRHDEALISYDRALKIDLDYAAAYDGRGSVLVELKRLDEALASYEHAIRIKPDHADTHVNLSACLLQLGNFARGWDEYEWRWQTKTYREARIALSAPMWKGQKLSGPLLVWNEQGLGDEIIYASMLNDLEPYANAITVCVEPRLVRLFQRSFGKFYVISRQTLAPNALFEAQIPLGSLGRYLRRSYSTFSPTAKPYLLACRARRQNLLAGIAQKDRLICGLSWSSNNPATGADKSLRLQDLVPVLNLQGIDFVDLQYGDTSREQAALYAATKLTLRHVAEIDNTNDIDGLAALMGACDVIVTVSNTTAHLAAALGKPVLLMLPFSRGLLWYWHTERTTNPWYPTVKTFHQPAFGDWPSVIDGVCQELTRQRATLHDAAPSSAVGEINQQHTSKHGSPATLVTDGPGAPAPRAPAGKSNLLIYVVAVSMAAILLFWLWQTL